MLQTPLGLIKIKKNGKEINYTEKNLPKRFGVFEVDKRYLIQIDCLEKNSIIEFILETELPIAIAETVGDEDLFLIIFDYKELNLAIGVEGDIPGIRYEHLQNGIKIIISEKCHRTSMKIIVSWLQLLNEDQSINVWFAADPSY